MRLLAHCYCGVQICLCLTFCGCSSATETLSRTASRDFKWHAREPAAKKEPPMLVARLMKEWECEIPKAQLGDYTAKVENAEQWSQLWTRWQSDKLVPDVDFQSSIVYVRVDDANDGNHRGNEFYRKSDGTIGVHQSTTLMGFVPSDRVKIHFFVVQRN